MLTHISHVHLYHDATGAIFACKTGPLLLQKNKKQIKINYTLFSCINIYFHKRYLWYRIIVKNLFCFELTFTSNCRVNLFFVLLLEAKVGATSRFYFGLHLVQQQIFLMEKIYQNYLLSQSTFVCIWNFCHRFGSKSCRKKRFSFAFASANMNEKMISLRVKLKKQMKKSLIFCLSVYVIFWN